MSDKHFFILLGLGVFGVYMAREAIFSGVKAAGNAVDPTNNDNIFAAGINAVGDILDDGGDNDSFSLGGWVYDLTHDDPMLEGVN